MTTRVFNLIPSHCVTSFHGTKHLIYREEGNGVFQHAAAIHSKVIFHTYEKNSTFNRASVAAAVVGICLPTREPSWHHVHGYPAGQYSVITPGSYPMREKFNSSHNMETTRRLPFSPHSLSDCQSVSFWEEIYGKAVATFAPTTTTAVHWLNHIRRGIYTSHAKILCHCPFRTSLWTCFWHQVKIYSNVQFHCVTVRVGLSVCHVERIVVEKTEDLTWQFWLHHGK